MRFEKINDDKIKIIITTEDLSERGIKMSDLRYGNKETSDLFQEIIQEAVFECEFDVENKAVLVEAVPMSINTIEVFVTKIEDEEMAEEVAGKVELINKIREKSEGSKKVRKSRLTGPDEIPRKDFILIKFKEIDDVCNVAKTAIDYFDGKDKLYKYEGFYYLIMDTSSNTINTKTNILENVFKEYGEIINNISYFFIEEHGTIMLEKDVIKNLKNV